MKIPMLGFRIGYIQWGPLLRREGQAAELDSEALRLLHDYTLSMRVHVLRIAPNIYTSEVHDDYKEALRSAGFEPVKQLKPYHTMLFPLDINEDQMQKRFHTKWRATLRKAEKNGMMVYESQDIPILSMFEKMYQKSRERKRFKGLNIQEFIRTQEKLLMSQKMNMVVVKKEDDLLSVDINSYLGDTSLGLFQATTEQGLSLGASYLAWWHTFLAAKRAGMRRYDMGGIDPEKNPSVYQYKLRMGADVAYHIGCYDAYADKWAKRFCFMLDSIYYNIKRGR
jgi:lipid II:glycine glycyltransferase (peptidoglycan interpeptide bridge formation enzyme)